MLNYFKASSIFLCWVLVALSSHYYISNKYFNNCNLSLNETKIATSTKDILFLNNEKVSIPIFRSSTGFTINKYNSNVSSILNIRFLKDSIVTYLTNDYSIELQITGKYTPSEINSKAIKNIGLQRANIVKNELISLGILSTRIKTFGKFFNFSFNNEDTYDNGIEMNFKTIQKTALDSIESNIANKTLYLNFINDSLIATKQLTDYTLILNQYLKKYSEKKVQIIGHTDNLGYYDKNLIVGMNKANKVREHLINEGILNKIETLSKGESEPIAEKTTEEGRAKNRRIEIKIN